MCSIPAVHSELLDPRNVFETLAGGLQHEDDLGFASQMVQTLNLILLTSQAGGVRSGGKWGTAGVGGRRREEAAQAAIWSCVGCSALIPTPALILPRAPTPNPRPPTLTLHPQEAMELRMMLKQPSEGAALFQTIYPAWSHNPVSLLSLCLLTQAFEHAAELVVQFAKFEMTLPFLVQIDKLVQLFESPIFTHVTYVAYVMHVPCVTVQLEYYCTSPLLPPATRNA